MATMGLLYLFAGVFLLVHVHASDPDPLQDFCVADLQSRVRVNGYVCKDPNEVVSSDFKFTGLRRAGNTSNAVGSVVTFGFAPQFPGLNTLGVSMARIDYAPGGQNPPHAHPRASEILRVIQGRLLAGFITTVPNYTLFTQTLEEGDVFVFPRGLIHFQQNVGTGAAVAIAAFNSQFPDLITIADAVFGSNPPLPDFILATAFNVSVQLVDKLQKNFQEVVAERQQSFSVA